MGLPRALVTLKGADCRVMTPIGLVWIVGPETSRRTNRSRPIPRIANRPWASVVNCWGSPVPTPRIVRPRWVRFEFTRSPIAVPAGLDPCREIATLGLGDPHRSNRGAGDRAAFQVDNSAFDRDIVPRKRDRQLNGIDLRVFVGVGPARTEAFRRRDDLGAPPGLIGFHPDQVACRHGETKSSFDVAVTEDGRGCLYKMTVVGQVELRTGNRLSIWIDDPPAVDDGFGH